MSLPGVVDILLVGLRNTSGQPLAGGKVSFYAAGTTTPKDTYTDAAGTTPATNPVILNSNGQAQVYAYGNYKIVVHDAADALLYTWDDLAFASPLTLLTAWQSWTPTYGGEDTLTYTGVTLFKARYTVVGKVATFAIRTTAGTVGGSGNAIYITAPAGITLIDNGAPIGCKIYENGAWKLGAIGRHSTTQLTVEKADSTDFHASSCLFGGTFVSEIA